MKSGLTISDSRTDDVLVERLEELAIPYRRGPVDDVLTRYLDLADGFVVRSSVPPSWPGIPVSLIERKPIFPQPLGLPLPPALLQLVRSTLSF